MSKLKTTMPIRLYPTPKQCTVLQAHCQEYISAITVLVQALDSDVLPEGGRDTSTKDFTAALPSAVKNQALRDARSVWKRTFELGIIPVLRKPICQWNNQNWRIEGDTLMRHVSSLHRRVGFARSSRAESRLSTWLPMLSVKRLASARRCAAGPTRRQPSPPIAAPS